LELLLRAALLTIGKLWPLQGEKVPLLFVPESNAATLSGDEGLQKQLRRISCASFSCGFHYVHVTMHNTKGFADLHA
jgi:hypothetical protein